MLERPGTDEYFEFYRTYVGQVPDGNILDTLTTQSDRVVKAFSDVPSHLETFVYAPGKWTVREVLGHISDAERVFMYRALTMARADETHLPGFDENDWAVHSNAGIRPLGSLVDEFTKVRAATVALLASFTEEMGRRQGTASNRPISVRAIAWIAAGHAEHHFRLFEERYRPAFESEIAG